METPLKCAMKSRPFMEHRWGQSVTLDLPAVQLQLGGELLGHGRMRNASISGAVVETDAKLPLLASLEVVVRTPSLPAGRVVLPACVVRRAADGLGVEWRDMSCENVVALLRSADAAAALWRKDRVFS